MSSWNQLTEMDLHKMSRRELQALAKGYGIKANQRTEDIIDQLGKDMGKQSKHVGDENKSGNGLAQRMSILQLESKKATPKKFESPLAILMRRVSSSGSRLKNQKESPSLFCTPIKTSDTEIDMKTEAKVLSGSPDGEKDLAKRVTVAVNAIKALQTSKHGLPFDKICDFIKVNSASDFNPGSTSVQLHRALRIACSDNLVHRSKTFSGEIRFSVPETVSASVVTKTEVMKKPSGSFESNKIEKSAIIEALKLERRRRLRQAKSEKRAPQNFTLCTKCLKIESSSRCSNTSNTLMTPVPQHETRMSEEKLVVDSSESGGAWQLRESRSKPGKFYYYNTLTRETTWNRPYPE